MKRVSLQAKWTVKLDARLAAQVEMAMWDDHLRKPKYGSRKALVEHLLIDWLAQETAKAKAISAAFKEQEENA